MCRTQLRHFIPLLPDWSAHHEGVGVFYFMAQGKKSFILYSDQRGIFDKLNDEQAGKLVKHIYAYVNDENPVGDFVTELAFESIKTQLKRDLKKWEGQREQRSLAGKASAESRKRKSTSVNESERKSTVNVNVNDNVSVNDSVNANVNDKKKTIEDRKREFYNSLIPYLEEYSKETLKDFYEYWTEHGPRQRKFRAEKEKAFDLNRRLKKWKENETRFTKNKPGSNEFIRQLAQTDEWKDA